MTEVAEFELPSQLHNLLFSVSVERLFVKSMVVLSGCSCPYQNAVTETKQLLAI